AELLAMSPDSLHAMIGNARNSLNAILGNPPVGERSPAISIVTNNRQTTPSFGVSTSRSPVVSPMSSQFSLKKVAVALSGGGSGGDFQTGALRFLYDNVFDRPDIITGTSVGAVNGAQLAQGDADAMDVLQATWNGFERLDQYYVRAFDFDSFL